MTNESNLPTINDLLDVLIHLQEKGWGDLAIQTLLVPMPTMLEIAGSIDHAIDDRQPIVLCKLSFGVGRAVMFTAMGEGVEP